MQRAYLCALFLVVCLDAVLSVEIIKPNPPNGELLVHDFTTVESKSKNSMGYSVATTNEMEMTLVRDDDPRVILTPTSTSSFFYTFLRQSGQCFNGSNFDYISLDLKHDDDISFLVAFFTSSIHCDENTNETTGYSMIRVSSTPSVNKRNTCDIPFSAIAGNASKANINTIAIGGLRKPLELYSIKLKSQDSASVTKATVAVMDEIPADSESSDLNDSAAPLVADEPITDLTPETSTHSILIVEDFATNDDNVNALGGTHGSDGTMSEVHYTTDQGVSLRSSSSSSYWYTVIPCENTMTYNIYDELVLDVVGPKGGDFNIRIKTQVQCEDHFKDFVFIASSLLKTKLDETQQQIIIPFSVMDGFDKSVHTIQSIIIGDFQNQGENHNTATPMDLTVKSLSIRGLMRNDSNDDDSEQEHIQANEKKNPIDYENIEDKFESRSGSSKQAISVYVAIVSALLLFAV